MKNYKFLFFSLMLMSCMIDVDTPVRVSMLSAFKENAKVARGVTGNISGAYYGSLAGLRALTDTGVKMAYINDYGAGKFVQDPLDGSSADNTWQTIIAASGKRYKRQWDGQRLQVEWFGVKGDGITDNTDSLQKAVNTAYKKELVFDKRGYYRTDRINIPSGIKLTGNGCKIAPVANFSGGALFYTEIIRNSISTGLYAGGGAQPAIRPNIKNVYDIEVSGFNADLEMSRLGFVVVNASNAPNTVFNKFWVHDNTIRNFAFNAISIFSEGRSVDTSCFIKEIRIEGNDIRYNGMAGLAVSENRYTGDTSIAVYTIDNKPIETRLKNSIGKYFWFGSPIVSIDSIDNYGYNTTNCYFRLKSYTINPNAPSRADIKIEGGSYDAGNGWIKNKDNTGLRARIQKYNMILPVDQQSGPLLFMLPNFTAGSGATTLTRATSSTQQDAYHRNLTVGMKFSLNDGSRGSYTVTGVGSGTITITPALDHPVKNVLLVQYTKNADCIAVGGNFKDCYVINNFGYGAAHFLGVAVAAPKRKWAEEGNSEIHVDNNTWWYMWMGVESPTLTPRVRGYAPFNNIAVAKNDTSFTPSVPSRMGAKDMGSGAVKFITASATTDAKVAIENSYFVGDIIAWPGEHYRMVIRDIYLNAGHPAVSLRRFDTYRKVATDSGFSATVSNLQGCYRLYNREYGETGMPRYMGFKNNYGYYSVRNSGGNGGYDISCLAYDMDIIGNHFTNSEKSALEPHAVNITVEGNWFYNYVFDGSAPRPSVTNRKGGPGINHGGWGTVIGSRVSIKNNHFYGEQPATGDYSFNTGNILIQPNMLVLPPMEKFCFTNNVVDGLTCNLFKGVGYNVINGVSYLPFYFDFFEVANNIINATPRYQNLGWANNTLASKKLVLQNNTITIDREIADLKIFSANSRPNPELFDSTKAYQISVENKYNATPDLNSPFLKGHAGVLWNDKSVAH